MSDYNKSAWTPDDIARLKELINEGCRVLQEIDDLKEGLKDTVKSIAEELEIKPTQLNKAIRTAHKSSLDEEKEALHEIEDILSVVGRK